jgi:hypothetical protein
MTKRSLAVMPLVLLTVTTAARSQPDAEQVYVLTAPEHTMEQVQKASSPRDVLLMTAAFGQMDPRDDKQWKEVEHPGPNDYRARLIAQAGELKTGLVDMTDDWGRYVRGSGKDLHWFKRDEVHANERGEKIIGRTLAAHLAPPLPGK